MFKHLIALLERVISLYPVHKKIFLSYFGGLIALIITGYLAFSSNSPLKSEAPSIQELSLTEFWQYLQQDKITEITFFTRSWKIYGVFKRGQDKMDFKMNIPVEPKSIADSLKIDIIKFAKTNEKIKIKFEEIIPEHDDPRVFAKSIFWMIIVIIVIATFILFTNQSNFFQAKSFTTENSGKEIEQTEKVKFDDVGGIDEAKEEIKIAVEFLQNPQKFTKLGAKMPKGYLLIGPPGTGKTLLAKAVAGEANCPFFSAEGAGFVEVFVGVGPARVKNLFEKAKQNKPCIIFIDDIDSVGRARNTSKIGNFSGNQEYENTLLQLLVSMDGMNTSDGIVVFGATNRPESLDPALVRPGRFDRQIVVGIPDLKGREAILKIHTRNIKLNPDFDHEKIAKSIPGFAGADIANLANQAAILAVRKDKKQVDEEDFNESRDNIIQGPKRKILISEREKKMIAYHEAGHSIASIFTKNAEVLEKVSVIPRGMSLGATFQTPGDNVFLTKEQINAKLIILMSGRIGEKIISNTISTGAKNDFEKATDLARKMVCEWGMSEKIGPIVYSDQNSAFLSKDNIGIISSEKMRYEIDREVKEIISEAETEATNLIQNHEKELKILAERLIEKETLNKDEIYKLLDLRI